MAENPQSEQQWTTRTALWRELLWRKPIVFIVLIVAFTSTAGWLWDELVAPFLKWIAPLSRTERPRLFNLFLWLPWYGWAIAGLVVLVIVIVEHSYKLIHAAEGKLESVTGLPVSRPIIVPVGYGKDTEYTQGYGLFFANDGYAANTVSIPDVEIGSTKSKLSFRGTLSRLAPGAKDFLEATITNPEHPERDGSQLHKEMVRARIDEIEVGIVYKSTDLREFRSNCVLTRTPGQTGLDVSFKSQELAGIS